ncbi:hypothetical protein D9M73_251210 [compost metagenome]
MQGPDTTGQTAGAEQTPLALGSGLLYVVQAFCHAQGGEAACASNQKRKYDQVRVVLAL